VENVEILFAVHNWIEYHNRARDSYTGEPDTVAWIRKNLKAGDVLWDVGANVGAYSILAAKLVPKSTVVAFEPYIPTFAHLWDNIVLNACTERIVPVCTALSDHTTLDNLGISDPRAGSSQHVLGGKNFGLLQPSISIRGDDLIPLFNFQKPNLVKLDVDGYELQVLKGMTRLLKDHSLRSLIVEVESGKSEQPVSDLLSRAGFERVSDSKGLTGIPVFNVVYERETQRDVKTLCREE